MIHQLKLAAVFVPEFLTYRCDTFLSTWHCLLADALWRQECNGLNYLHFSQPQLSVTLISRCCTYCFSCYDFTHQINTSIRHEARWRHCVSVNSSFPRLPCFWWVMCFSYYIYASVVVFCWGLHTWISVCNVHLMWNCSCECQPFYSSYESVDCDPMSDKVCIQKAVVLTCICAAHCDTHAFFPRKGLGCTYCQ